MKKGYISIYLMLVAEIGGYLGMILGVSLLDLEVVMKLLFSMLKDQKTRFGFH